MKEDKEFPFELKELKNEINMNEVVKDHDILFLCFDTLRYDVAKKLELENKTPVLNKYGSWQECMAPGNFTYPSHQSMFIGFLPAPINAKSIKDRKFLFFPKRIGLGNIAPKASFAYEGESFIEGLESIGYHTMCIGGVAFFDKRSDIGKIFPNKFMSSYWNQKFSCTNKESTKNQVDFTIKKIEELPNDKKVFCYINISAIHYPNYFYRDEIKKDNIESHEKSLEYVDKNLEKLFEFFKKRGKTFVIATSDHGTCYGEDGYEFHGFNHPIVNHIPYKHFFL